MTMKEFVIAAALLGSGGMMISAQSDHGHLPDWWAGWSHVSSGPRVPGHSSSLGGVVGQVQHDAMPSGGPQGFEGYVYDDHDTGTTRLTLGLVSNVELAGSGHTQEVRSSGGVITGAARVSSWSLNGGGVHVAHPEAVIQEVCALCPGWSGQIQSKKGVWLPEDTQKNRLPGITDIDVLRFPNGWTLQAAGDNLELRDRNGVVRRW